MVAVATTQNKHTPPYLTTTVFPLSDFDASAIVSAISEKFSGAAEIDVLVSLVGVRNAVDGAVKADAAENKVAVNVMTVNDFIVISN